MGGVPIKHKEISRSNVFKQYTLLFYEVCLSPDFPVLTERLSQYMKERQRESVLPRKRKDLGNAYNQSVWSKNVVLLIV